MKEKPDCYKCQYRGKIAGSAHSQCNHPVFKDIEPTFDLLTILSTAHRVKPFGLESPQCKVVGDSYGVRNGWFNHPFDFDPTWLISCTGYKPLEIEIKP